VVSACYDKSKDLVIISRGGTLKKYSFDSNRRKISKDRVSDPKKKEKFFIKGYLEKQLKKVRGELTFGGRLELILRSEQTQIPSFLSRSLDLIESTNDWLEWHHIYRQPGNIRAIDLLRKQVNCGKLEGLESCNSVYDLTTLVKQFFNELQIPLIPWFIYKEMEEVWESTDKDIEDPENRAISSGIRCSLEKLLFGMPKTHQQTLNRLMDHLQLVLRNGDKNKISLSSISTMFGPCLSRPPTNVDGNQLTVYKTQKTATRLLIQIYQR